MARRTGLRSRPGGPPTRRKKEELSVYQPPHTLLLLLLPLRRSNQRFLPIEDSGRSVRVEQGRGAHPLLVDHAVTDTSAARTVSKSRRRHSLPSAPARHIAPLSGRMSQPRSLSRL